MAAMKRQNSVAHEQLWIFSYNSIRNIAHLSLSLELLLLIWSWTLSGFNLFQRIRRSEINNSLIVKIIDL